MTKLLIIYLSFLLIKAVVTMIPRFTVRLIKKSIPYRKYTAEEVIKCGHMRPDLYYHKQLQADSTAVKPTFKRYKLKPKDIITLNYLPANTYREAEVDVNVIREQFKNKMKNRQLTRSQVIAIRKYLESIVDCTGKKFDNDCHCIYWCLKRLSSEGIMDLRSLTNLLK